ncbi:MAG TPA: AMP-binding protein [Polyangiaceae bacterium]|nr:AMP-binding protein [Polyangiaceae bacterium]
MSTLSIFDAAREQPLGTALVDGESSLSFADVADRCRPLVAALRSARPAVLALAPRADVESLLWIYAALAVGTPLLTLHQRATADERRRARELAGAVDVASLSIPLSSSGSEPSPAPTEVEAPALLIPTSGSTGSPRLVELSRRALLASAAASERNLGWEANDAWLLCLPLAHTGGLSIVTRCLVARRTLLLFESGGAGLMARLPELVLALQRASLVSLVPSVLAALLDASPQAPPRLRAVLLGGAACSPALAERAHAGRWPLLTSYGSTETASQVVTRRYAERYAPLPVRGGVVSSGHPLPGVELALDEGQLRVRARSLFTRYIGSATPELREGFLVTSDRGELGPDGELYVRGRSDDVIISGGENVDPLEVEAALLQLPGVTAACVTGTRSARFGEVVSALLVSREPALADPARLAELLSDRLARHKLPRRALIAESLPLTLSGKVDRRACRELLERAHAPSGSETAEPAEPT